MEAATLQKRLGSAMRERRTALDRSQESFADLIKMHRAYYSAIERGERNITLHTMYRVARGLGVSVKDLMEDARL
ncbi:helix-turn-helix domain-containing protein [Lysobacter sp. D1-1-M9]|uniref:helix-turn-helix domain-containing protein n=1 Tax=Novilysobacter longmucuonensis TaxID=3098603 RepID=UPI002FC6FA9E